jgi:hypothetical protein
MPHLTEAVRSGKGETLAHWLGRVFYWVNYLV